MAVLETVHEFKERIKAIAAAGRNTDWKIQTILLQNDLDEFMSTFEVDSTDFNQLNWVLHPYMVGYGGDPRTSAMGDLAKYDEALTLIEHRLQKGQSKVRTTDSDEHLIATGIPHSAYVLVRDIVEGTGSDLLVVDPYVGRELFDLLSNLKAPTSIRVLTLKAKLPRDFLTEASKFAKQNGHTIQIRAAADVHDRFLVVDGRPFMSGASFKDIGKKSSVIIEMTTVAAETVKQIESHWTGASVLL